MRGLRFLPRPIRTYFRAKKRRVEFNICFSEQAARGNGKHGFGKRISNWLKLFQRINDEQATEYTGQSDAEHMLAAIIFLCTQTDGTRGIWKRIDETRELFVCIKELGPEFLERCPWVEGWLSYQYSYLTSLRTLLNLPTHMEGFYNFPRPFPSSRFDWEATCEHLVESSRSKVPTWLREQAKGND